MELAQPGAYLSLQGANVDVYRGSMRLVVDKAGKVEVAEGQSFKPAVRPMRDCGAGGMHAVGSEGCYMPYYRMHGQIGTNNHHTPYTWWHAWTDISEMRTRIMSMANVHQSLCPAQVGNNLSLIEFEVVTVSQA